MVSGFWGWLRGGLARLKSENSEAKALRHRVAEEGADRLIEMGYFKFLPPSEFEMARQELIESLSNGYLDTEWNEELVSRDKRSYGADNEDLAEGSMGEFLLLMKDVLRLEGVTLESVEDDCDGDAYHLSINGQRVLVYDSTAAGGEIWGIAIKRFLEIVDELLQNAGSKERLYGIYGGNDGRCILLTDEMYALLQTPDLQIDAGWMPYRSTVVPS